MSKVMILILSIFSLNALATEYTIYCEEPQFCTQEFNPVTCAYQGDLEVAYGNNPCLAKMKIERAICETSRTETITLNTKDFVCCSIRTRSCE